MADSNFLDAMQFVVGLVGGFSHQAQQERARHEAERLQLLQLIHQPGDVIEPVSPSNVNQPTDFLSRAFGTGTATERGTGAPVYNIAGSPFVNRPYQAPQLDLSFLRTSPQPSTATAPTPPATAPALPQTRAPQVSVPIPPIPPEIQQQFPILSSPQVQNDPVFKGLVADIHSLQQERPSLRNTLEQRKVLGEIRMYLHNAQQDILKEQRTGQKDLMTYKRESTKYVDQLNLQPGQARRLKAQLLQARTTQEIDSIMASVAKQPGSEESDRERRHAETAMSRINTLLDRKRRILSGSEGWQEALVQIVNSQFGSGADPSKLRQDAATMQSETAGPDEKEAAKQRVLQAIDAEIGYWKQFAPREYRGQTGLGPTLPGTPARSARPSAISDPLGIR